MKKAVILSIYAILLIVTLIQCVIMFDTFGLFVYFVLGLLYALPLKLYSNYKEKKEKALRAKINAIKRELARNIDIWEALPNYAI